MGDHPLRPPNDRRLGEPLPHQLTNHTHAHLLPPKLLWLYDAILSSYGILIQVSLGYLPVRGKLHTRYAPVRRSPASVNWPAAPRLACIRPAASVHPEPGSNSPLYIILWCLATSIFFDSRFLNYIPLLRAFYNQAVCCLVPIIQRTLSQPLIHSPDILLRSAELVAVSSLTFFFLTLVCVKSGCKGKKFFFYSASEKWKIFLILFLTPQPLTSRQRQRIAKLKAFSKLTNKNLISFSILFSPCQLSQIAHF